MIPESGPTDNRLSEAFLGFGVMNTRQFLTCLSPANPPLRAFLGFGGGWQMPSALG